MAACPFPFSSFSKFSCSSVGYSRRESHEREIRPVLSAGSLHARRKTGVAPLLIPRPIMSRRRAVLLLSGCVLVGLPHPLEERRLLRLRRLNCPGSAAPLLFPSSRGENFIFFFPIIIILITICVNLTHLEIIFSELHIIFFHTRARNFIRQLHSQFFDD